MVTLRCKVAIVGGTAVGKSSLTQVFHSNGKQYPKNYVMTVGVDFCVKVVNIPETDAAVELYLFDSAGQYIFRELVPKYWEGVSAVILVYDATNLESFQACDQWLDLVRKSSPEKNIIGVLVANKMDLESRIAVPREQAESYASQQGLQFFECSAQRGTDVDVPFNFVANQFHELYRQKIDELTGRV